MSKVKQQERTEVQEAFDNLKKEFYNKKGKELDVVPNVLYHYTDTNGLIGILESKNIRLTHTNYLNDYSEVRHGWEITNELIQNISIKHTDNQDIQGFLNTLNKRDNPLEKEIEVFVASFCEKRDLLDQWRGYGASDGAFSIGIKTKEANINHDLFKVEYNEDTQKNHLEELLNDCINILKAHKTISTLDKVTALSTFYGIICSYLTFFKNDAFKSEEEWRTSHYFFKDEDDFYQDIRFGKRSGIVVPYVEFPLHQEGAVILPIESITYALSKDSSLTEKSIELLLKKHGYGKDKVKIIPSRVPLRFK